MRGNVVDLAVGVIIGGAFNKIVTSLVNDMLMPLISLFVGTSSLHAQFIALNGEAYASIEAAGSAPLLKYGSFLATVLDFVLMGFVIFLLVKSINFFSNKIKKDKPEPPVTATTKACPFCVSQIHIAATVCPQCTSHLETEA